MLPVHISATVMLDLSQVFLCCCMFPLLVFHAASWVLIFRCMLLIVLCFFMFMILLYCFHEVSYLEKSVCTDVQINEAVNLFCRAGATSQFMLLDAMNSWIFVPHLVT